MLSRRRNGLSTSEFEVDPLQSVVPSLLIKKLHIEVTKEVYREQKSKRWSEELRTFVGRDARRCWV